MTSRLVVLATGSGSNLQAILDACAVGRLEAEVVLVVVNRRTAYAAERAAAASAMKGGRFPTAADISLRSISLA